MEREFGRRLRAIRMKKGLTQQQFASLVGVDVRYISRVERGIVPPPLPGLVKKFCKILEVPPEQVLPFASKVLRDFVPEGSVTRFAPTFSSQLPDLNRGGCPILARELMQSRMRKLTELEPGAHVCAIYWSEEEHRRLVTPFIRQGLERNEKVMYFTDAHTPEQILDYLRADGIDVEHYLARRQLNFFDASDLYKWDNAFDPDKTIKLLQAELEATIAAGYSALRMTAEMSWALRGLPGSERLLDYETRVGTLPPDTPCLAMCQYDGRRFAPSLLLDIAMAHPLLVSVSGRLPRIP